MSLAELSVLDQRYAAVMEVITHGLSKAEVARRYGVSRQSVDTWVKRYRAGGVDALKDGSHRPLDCPHQMLPEVEARICDLRRQHMRWGPKRITWQLMREGIDPLPSESAVYRALVRNGLIDAARKRKKRSDYTRWERPSSMQLWQMDIVGGVFLADGRECKVVTGVDDHSRFCVVSAVVERATGRAVSVAFAEALRRHGVPDEVLTDNGKQFTDRFSANTPAEVLFDRICRENGISHRLTGPRSPTTTGKIERFHRSLREELLNDAEPFESVEAAQEALDAWVEHYNAERPHQAIAMDRPTERFEPRDTTVLPVEVPKAVEDPSTLVPLELDVVVTPTGNTTLADRQFWLGKHLTSKTVTVQVTSTTVTALFEGEIIKQVTSRFTPKDIKWLWARGAKRPRVVVGDVAFSDTIEIFRKVNPLGSIGVGGKPHQVGARHAGKRVAIRLEAQVMHIFDGDQHIKTLPSPVPPGQRMKLFGAHPAPPFEIETDEYHEVQRRVGRHGTVMVAKQSLKVGTLHEGKIVTIHVDDERFKVFIDDDDPLVIKRLTKGEVRNFGVTRSPSFRADRQASTEDKTSSIT